MEMIYFKKKKEMIPLKSKEIKSYEIKKYAIYVKKSFVMIKKKEVNMIFIIK